MSCGRVDWNGSLLIIEKRRSEERRCPVEREDWNGSLSIVVREGKKDMS